ncbi:flippase [Vibrio artabrorum]|uniref:flippase n=1 Tax=Vibrio artabrorum TaxID=446374 RepID=UPI0035524AB7
MNKKIISDIGVMAFLQATSLLLPVLIIPFILSIYDVESYGEMAFATSICLFFNVVVDYGFNLTSTSEIGKSNGDIRKVSQIFTTTLMCKIFIFIVSTILYFSFVYVYNLVKEDSNFSVYVMVFGLVLANTLNPIWLFQGLGKLKAYSTITIICKIIVVAGIFIIVDKNTDFYVVPLMLSLSQIIPAVFGLLYAIIKLEIKLTRIDVNLLRLYFIQGKEIFFSRISVYSYTSLNIVFLEFFTSTIYVGYYSVAARVIGALNSIINVISQVLFPKMARIWEHEKNHYFKFFIDNRNKLACVNVIAGMATFLLAKLIILFLVGEENIVAINVLRILSLSLLFYSFGSMYTQNLIIQNENKSVLKITILTTFINFVFVFVLVPTFGIYGMAITACLIQLTQFLLNVREYHRVGPVKNRC